MMWNRNLRSLDLVYITYSFSYVFDYILVYLPIFRRSAYA